MSYDKTAYYKDSLYEGDLVYYAISRDGYRRDGSQYTSRLAAVDDVRTSFSDSLEQRQREWMSARAGAE